MFKLHINLIFEILNEILNIAIKNKFLLQFNVKKITFIPTYIISNLHIVQLFKL